MSKVRGPKFIGYVNDCYCCCSEKTINILTLFTTCQLQEILIVGRNKKAFKTQMPPICTNRKDYLAISYQLSDDSRDYNDSTAMFLVDQ